VGLERFKRVTFCIEPSFWRYVSKKGFSKLIAKL
jgi:hypothetical protein